MWQNVRRLCIVVFLLSAASRAGEPVAARITGTFTLDGKPVAIRPADLTLRFAYISGDKLNPVQRIYGFNLSTNSDGTFELLEDVNISTLKTAVADGKLFLSGYWNGHFAFSKYFKMDKATESASNVTLDFGPENTGEAVFEVLHWETKKPCSKLQMSLRLKFDDPDPVRRDFVFQTAVTDADGIVNFKGMPPEEIEMKPLKQANRSVAFAKDGGGFQRCLVTAEKDKLPVKKITVWYLEGGKGVLWKKMSDQERKPLTAGTPVFFKYMDPAPDIPDAEKEFQVLTGENGWIQTPVILTGRYQIFTKDSNKSVDYSFELNGLR